MPPRTVSHTARSTGRVVLTVANNGQLRASAVFGFYDALCREVWKREREGKKRMHCGDYIRDARVTRVYVCEGMAVE